jgi:sulfate permease, SulP family
LFGVKSGGAEEHGDAVTVEGDRSRTTPGWRRRIVKLVPVLTWLPHYQRQDLRGDLIAGVTVGAMIIPQGMAYALLAGLPPQAGLYASMVPLVVYAIFGQSRQLGVGPTAISSLLALDGIAPLAGGDPARYAALAAMLAVMVGLMRVGLGLARLGFLVNFLSGPVIAGFTSAAALVIAASQLEHLFGVPLTDSSRLQEVISDFAPKLDGIHGATVAVGLCGLVALLLLHHLRPGWPAALITVVAATVAVAVLDLDGAGVAVVGDVPRSLPVPSWPSVGWDESRALLPAALAITILGFVESIAIAKVYARRLGYSIRPNQELIAVGAATVSAGLVGGYPVSGSFSRTAVNAEAGARTMLAGVVTALVVLVTVVGAAPLLQTLPKAVLAGVVVSAVAGLVEVAEARRLWSLRRSDFAMLALAFVGTMTLGVELGLAISVAASLVLVIRQASSPHTAVLGCLPDSTVYRNVDRFPEARTRPGLAVLRFDAPIYFVNVEFFRDRIRKVERTTPGGLRALVLDASAINDVDASGAVALSELVDDYAARGIHLQLAQVKGPVLDMLRRCGLYDRLGPDRFSFTDHEAVCRAAAAIEPAGPDLDRHAGTGGRDN